MAGSIFIPLISVFDGKGVTQAKGALAGLGTVAKTVKGNLAAMAVSFATVGIFDFVKNATTAARDLQTNVLAVQNTFGNLSPDMLDFTKSAQHIGLSQLEAARAVNFLGNALYGNGLSMEDAAAKSKNLISLGADLSATFGRDIPETLTALSAAFRGEYDPIEKFGVAIKQAQVNALVLERGQNKLTGSAKAAAMAQARYDLIMKAAEKNQGNYAKMQDTLFVKQNNLRAAFENMKSTVAQSLLDPLSKLMGFLGPVVDKLTAVNAKSFGALGKALDALSPVIPSLMDGIAELLDLMAELSSVIVDTLEPVIPTLIEGFTAFAKVLKDIKPALMVIVKILGSVLLPIIDILGFAISLLIKGLELLVSTVEKIPGIGDFLKDANNALDDFKNGYDSLNSQLVETKSSSDDLIDSLSHAGYVSNAIDEIKTSATATQDALNKAAKSMDKVIDNAKNTQKGLISAFDITSILKDNQNVITESVVYVGGKFKTIINNVASNSGNLVSTFKNNLRKLKDFYKDLMSLKSMNLNKELIDQIVQAGPDAGKATAEAILASGKSGVKALNSTYKDIKSLTGTIAAENALAIQNLGADIGNGLIDGLVAQKQSMLDRASAIGVELGSALATAAGAKARAGWNPFKDNPVSFSLVGKTLNIGTQQDKPKFEMLSPSFLNNSIVTPAKLGLTPAEFANYKSNLNTANNYNIQVNVAAGTSPRDVNAALIKAIKEYERTRGQ